jgi:TolB protein
MKKGRFMICNVKRSITLFLFICSSCLLTNSMAMNLELTQGVDKAIPVALIDFSNPVVTIPGKTNLTSVIKNDLSNSGRFEVSPYKHDDALEVPDTQHYNQWRQLGVSDVITGTLKKEADGNYAVTAQLFDVYTRALLWHQTFHAPRTALRHIAHQISDQVYLKLTGIPGVFTTKIAYVLVQGHAPGPKRYLLEVADQDGFNAQPLVVSPMPIMSPVWSPDGQQIAYVSFEHHRATIYLQNVADGSRITMSALPGINGAPAFSPDGKSLALVRSVTGNPKIYLMTIATGQVKPLTTGYAMDTEPAFSPDGSQLMFTSSRDGGVQLYQYTLATGAITRLTYTGNYNATGHYLPNNTGFVMLHRDQGIFSIAKQDISDSGHVAILDRADSDESPSVSPNGQMVIYSTLYQGRRVLAMVSIDGQIKLRLPSRDGNVQDPAWSPYLNSTAAN